MNTPDQSSAQHDESRHDANERETVSLSVFDLVEIVLKRKVYWIGLVILCSAIGLVYCQYAESTYKVTARVLVQPRGLLLDDDGADHEDEFLATQSEIIRSPVVVHDALDSIQLPLNHLTSEKPSWEVLKQLSVKPVDGTNVLSVSYPCTDADEGITLVHALIASYQQFSQQVDDDSRLEALDLLTRSEERMREELEQRKKEYSDLRRESPLIGRGRSGNTLQEQMLAELGRSLSEVRQRRFEIENRLAILANDSASQLAMSSADPNRSDLLREVVHRPVLLMDTDGMEPDGIMPSVTRPVSTLPIDLLSPPAESETAGAIAPNANELLQQLSKAEVELKEIAQYCGPDHPRYVAASGRVDVLQQQIDQMSDMVPAVLRRELATITDQESQLLTQFEKESATAKENDSFRLREQQALDGLERVKAIHSSLVVQLNDWRLASSSEEGNSGTDVLVIEEPSIGTGPVWPKPAIVLVLSASIGLLLSCVLIAWLERERLVFTPSR
ncbi:MAG: Wzz/FepE/Etk N-terminal domain-containing protein [Planctomycetota bacterium]